MSVSNNSEILVESWQGIADTSFLSSLYRQYTYYYLHQLVQHWLGLLSKYRTIINRAISWQMVVYQKKVKLSMSYLLLCMKLILILTWNGCINHRFAVSTRVNTKIKRKGWISLKHSLSKSFMALYSEHFKTITWSCIKQASTLCWRWQTSRLNGLTHNHVLFGPLSPK